MLVCEYFWADEQGVDHHLRSDEFCQDFLKVAVGCFVCNSLRRDTPEGDMSSLCSPWLEFVSMMSLCVCVTHQSLFHSFHFHYAVICMWSRSSGVFPAPCRITARLWNPKPGTRPIFTHQLFSLDWASVSSVMKQHIRVWSGWSLWVCWQSKLSVSRRVLVWDQVQTSAAF